MCRMWVYVFLVMGAYSKYNAASITPVQTLVRPVAPAYLKLTFPHPIATSPPVYTLPHPVAPAYTLPQADSRHNVIIDLYVFWSNSVAAGVIVVLILLATNPLLARPSPDLPSDPNLYKAYLCRVLSIKSEDVIDLTGHIDRDIAQFIAAGGSGEVYKALWKDIRTRQALPMVVVKLIRLPPIKNKADKHKRYKRIKRELLLWSKLNHPHILPLIGIARVEDNANLPAFISPWMENGNVMEFLKYNPSFPVTVFLKDVIKGLHYLHTFDPVIVHGDIKGPNVLINHRREAYLSDFGLSHLALDNSLWCTTATHANGTLRWMAPELMEGDVIVPTIATDIYAFGMTCYEILSRGSPFATVNDVVVISKVIKGQRPEKVESCHSDEIWSIITRCWAQAPEDRPSTEETLQLVLQHDTSSNL